MGNGYCIRSHHLVYNFYCNLFDTSFGNYDYYHGNFLSKKESGSLEIDKKRSFIVNVDNRFTYDFSVDNICS